MDSTDIYNLIRNKFEFNPTSGQEELLQQLSLFVYRLREPEIFVLKGYAGTGKTSIVSALVKAMPEIRVNTMLLAPTGRAAKVLSNYSGRPAYTIHKKIYKTYADGNGSVRIVLQKNKHRNTLFVVDEASMIPDMNLPADGNLFSVRSLLEDLFHFVQQGINCKLLLIGDSAQLPPVGLAESPALTIDFLEASFNIPVKSFELTEVMRQAKTSGILENATILRTKIAEENYTLPLFNASGFTDFIKLSGSELEDALNTAYSANSFEDVAIICRSNKRANIFNQEVRNRILFRDSEIGAGDYMMVLKNNYYWLPLGSEAEFIANGDLMEIQRIYKIEEIYGFRFADVSIRLIDHQDEQTLDVKILLDTIALDNASLNYADSRRLFNEVMKDYEEIPNKQARFLEAKKNPYLNALQVKFAYAFTCHKTQGGQWNTVFVDQGYFTDDMLNVEFLRWMYTAITRATQKIYLVNFQKEFFNDTNTL